MDRLAEFEHHVVGDVDGQRDRSHAGERRRDDHPRRCRPGRVDAAHGARREDGAARRVPRIGRRSSIVTGKPSTGSTTVTASGGVAERRSGRVRVLARDAADREGVAAVGRHVDLDGGVIQAEQLDRVALPALVEAELGEPQDAVVLVAEAELARGGDHAVGDVSVGLAGRDRERPGQHGAGQRHDDLVAGGEVVGAADDAARLGLADIHLAPVDGLAVRSAARSTNSRHLADDDRAGHVEAVDVLLFEADLHEGGVHVLERDVLGQVDPLAQPAERDAHQTTIPNCLREAHVALDHVAHVVHVVAELQRALDAHAEREALVLVGVDARPRAARSG